jgi:hypothetical protein
MHDLTFVGLDDPVSNLTLLMAVLAVSLWLRPRQKELRFTAAGVLAAVSALSGGAEFVITLSLIVCGVGLAMLAELKRRRRI